MRSYSNPRNSQVVNMLNCIYSGFDDIINKNEAYKVYESCLIVWLVGWAYRYDSNNHR